LAAALGTRPIVKMALPFVPATSPFMSDYFIAGRAFYKLVIAMCCLNLFYFGLKLQMLAT
jgi:hypothetical protein